MDRNLCRMSAVGLREQLAQKRLSAVEVLDSFLGAIETHDGKVGAIPTLVAAPARERAAELDEATARGAVQGPLHGLPIAIKDLVDTAGIRTTQGSPLFADRVPDRDALMVERIRNAGAVVIGKTNVPEFGAGSHTFNPVFGATHNPWNLGRSAGGSSGGAAAALTARLLPIADGSDMGGSLRNPAAFCNVVGFRPTPGRVPRHPNTTPWDTLSVLGPMGRSVADAALLFSAIAGSDRRDPLSLEAPGSTFCAPLDREWKGARIAWTPDLGRLLVEAENVRVCEAALGALRDLGCSIEPDHPDLGDAREPFLALRSSAMAAAFPPDYERLRGRVKDTILWNTSLAYGQTAADLGRARLVQGALYQRVIDFFERYDFLVLPTTQVAPFPVEWDWVHEINGVPLETYLDWMESCWAITMTGCPALSVPAGFTREGLPVGLQIVAPPREDFALLQLAHAFEGATRHAERLPPLLDPGSD